MNENYLKSEQDVIELNLLSILSVFDHDTLTELLMCIYFLSNLTLPF